MTSPMLRTTSLILILLVALPTLSAQVTYLEKPQESLSALFKVISQAERSLDITYYEANPCHTVTKVLARAIQQRKSEVPQLRVRFLFDAHPLEEGGNQQLVNLFSASGAQVRLYNNSYKFLPVYNNRNHAKYVVADDQLITGGRNLTDAYYGMAVGETNWIDGDVLISDPKVASQGRKHFNEIWSNNYIYSLKANSLRTACLKWGSREENLFRFLTAQHQNYLAASKSTQCQKVRFIADNTEFKSVSFDWESQTQIGGGFEKLNHERVDKKPTIKALVQLLSVAQKMTLINHIYIPFGRIGELLDEKRKSGVPITLYTTYYRNSGLIFEDIHNYYLAKNSKGSQKNYSIADVERPDFEWEFSAPQVKYSNHGKVYVVNSRDVAVTSINFDPRSYMHNLESGAFIQNCPVLAQHIEQAYSARLTKGLSAQETFKLQKRAEGYFDQPVTTPTDRTMAWFILQFL